MALKFTHTAPNTWMAVESTSRAFVIRRYTCDGERTFEVWKRTNARTQFEANEYVGEAYTMAEAKKVATSHAN